MSPISEREFAKKPAIAENNIKVVNAGYDYGHNVHASVPATYRMSLNLRSKAVIWISPGNKATAYGLIAAAEKAGLKLYLGILSPCYGCSSNWLRHKSCGVITV